MQLIQAHTTGSDLGEACKSTSGTPVCKTTPRSSFNRFTSCPSRGTSLLIVYYEVGDVGKKEKAVVPWWNASVELDVVVDRPRELTDEVFSAHFVADDQKRRLEADAWAASSGLRSV